MGKSAFGGSLGGGPGKVEFEIAENGEILFKTGDMSGPDHDSADDFLRDVEQLAGGKVVKRSLPKPLTRARETVKTKARA